MPDLNFRVEAAEALEFAAVPTLVFKLHIENLHAEPVRSVTLHTQIRIVPNGRPYGVREQARLLELFGEPHRWGDTLKSFLWAHTIVLIPPFTGSTVVEMPVTCTYDFEVVSAKYFHAVGEGDIPLEFLFNGTIFYQGSTGALQAVQIPWEKEAEFRLPVSVWKRALEHVFPNSAWLRVSKDTFDRLYSYKVHRGSSSWDAALEDLLRSGVEKVEP
jgi:hypothetical protein